MRLTRTVLLALWVVLGSALTPLAYVPTASAQSAQSFVRLDGATGYVEVPGDGSVAGATAMTVEAWVRPTVLPVDFISVIARPGYQLGIRQSGTGFIAVLRVKLGPHLAEGTWQELTTVTAGPLATRQWYHLAWTYDGNLVRLFVNGVERARLVKPGEINDAPAPLRIGNQLGSTIQFAGDIDEVRISNVVRPIVPSATPAVADANTLGLWHFDATSADASPHAHTATLVGGATFAAGSPVGMPKPAAPVISALGAGDRAARTATVTWTTSTPSTSQVVYTIPSGVQTEFDPSLVTSHSVKIGGLAPVTSYSVAATSIDAFGTTSATPTASIVTLDESTSARLGEWSPPDNWPLVGVQSTLMYTGDILTWDAWELPGTPSVRVWDPEAPANQDAFTHAPASSQVFCSGVVSLEDGRLLVVGGHNTAAFGIHDVNLFDPITRAWSSAPVMSLARWYPSATRLPDGRVLALGGQTTPGVVANRPEIFNPATNTWTSMFVDTSDLATDKYPFSYVLPNGKFFAMSGQLGTSRLLDLNTQAYTPAISSVSPVLNGSPVMYRPGKLLVTGGGHSALSERTAVVTDLTKVTPTWRSVTPMAFPRTFHNLITLPDGNVLALGGDDKTDTTGAGQLTPELWNPDTEVWTSLAPARDHRGYHSSATLLPDGRVLVAGGGRFDQTNDTYTSEIYSPPYLFKGQRPTISSAPATTSYGASISVASPDAASIASVALTDLGSVTHSVDMDQRFLPLTFTRSGTTLSVNAPISSKLAPPGYYLLWLVNQSGVPSVSSMIHISGPSQPMPPPTVSISAQSVDGPVYRASVAVTTSVSTAFGVNEVQLEIDGQPVGQPLTVAPYTVIWDTTQVPNGSHRLTARATDRYGNLGQATEMTVQVQNLSAPVITSVDTSGMRPGARISWVTDVPSTTQLQYGPGLSLTTPLDPTLSTNHDVPLPALPPGTVFQCVVVSTNAQGVRTVSAPFTVRIPAGSLPPTSAAPVAQPGGLSPGGAGGGGGSVGGGGGGGLLPPQVVVVGRAPGAASPPLPGDAPPPALAAVVPRPALAAPAAADAGVPTTDVATASLSAALLSSGLSITGLQPPDGSTLALSLNTLAADQVGGLPDGFVAADQPFQVAVQNTASGEIVPDLAVPLQLTQQLGPTQLGVADGDVARVYLAMWTASGWQAQPCSRDVNSLNCPLARPGTFEMLVAPPPSQPADVDVPGGHFYRQANGFSSAGALGYAVLDDADASFWSEFQRLGGVQQVGFPISQRFQFHGFLTQAFQKMVLQWRPELGQAVPVNVFDELHARGTDGWLDERREVPVADDTGADASLTWDEVVARHVALLDAYPALHALYVGNPAAIDTFGLPLAVHNYGPVVAVRLQRATLQQWTVETSWAAAGSVVIGNGGDIAKEAGLWPLAATAPRPQP